MDITQRQKNIVNPYAMTTDEDGRKGVGYDYENRENRFVLDAIHEKYIYFLEFPEVNTVLNSFSRENNRITLEDMLAYFALYPQNGRVVGDQPSKITATESRDRLRVLADKLKVEGSLQKYSSRTSEVSYEKEFINQDFADLIAIPPEHSLQYRQKLRNSLALPELDYASSAQRSLDILQQNPDVAVYLSSDSNVDLYDWRNNGLPGENNDRVYYNPVDTNYYYVKRTNSTDDRSYAFNNLRNTVRKESVSEAVGKWSRYPDDAKERYKAAVENGIREILKLTDRNSEQNFNALSDIFVPPSSYTNVDRRIKGEDCFPLITYKDIRPGSRWVYAIKIDSAIVSSLEVLPVADSEEDLTPSYEEFEKSSLSKAQALIGNKNKSFTSVKFNNLDMVRYLLPVRMMLRKMDEKLTREGLTPEVINGVDLQREAVRLESFFELLELFYNYNKISLDDEDFVEIFFTDKFLIDHIVINGSFYYQGCGLNNYINLQDERARLVNSFSLFTPTTFSILRYAYEIYNEVNQNSDIDPIRFLNKYTYPVQDINALTVKRQNARKTNERIAKKRKTIFTTLSRLSSENSALDYERLFQNRDTKYRISSILSSIDCNTGQARSAKYALRFWNASTSKTKWRSLIRETILLLRNEVIEDERARQFLARTSSAINPNGQLGLTREAEAFINSQIDKEISCMLDVVGDFVENQFLDPLQAPPPAAALVRKTIDQRPGFEIEFKIQKPISVKTKQAEIYEKAVKTILLNFVKAALAGVIKDVVNATLGCGPYQNKTGRIGNGVLKSPASIINFGGGKLDQSLFSVDFVEVAKLISLQNEIIEVIDGDNVERTSPATLDQLNAFVSDVAKMCTPSELQQLLDGDAEYDLIQHILEVVTSTIELEKFDINPNIYNTLNFTNDKIRDFFITLGDAANDIDPSDLTGLISSPLVAYCAQKEGSLVLDSEFIDPLMDISQIEEQYYEIVQAKVNKINFLCDSLRDLTNMQVQLERLLDSIPDMDWYDNILQFIADISNGIANSIAAGFSSIFNKDQQRTVRRQTDYNLYCSDLGTNLYFQIFFPLREVPINQFYNDGESDGFLTPATWNPTRVGFGFTVPRDGEDVQFRGNFGARKNQYTSDRVYKYIWQDNRDTRLGRSIIEPPRLGLPQYRSYVQESYESWDSAYYGLRNAPEILKRRFQASPNRLTMSELNKIESGSPTRGAVERQYLSSVARRMYIFFTDEETRSPYIGWTGATFLTYNPNQNISISFFNADSTQDLVAEYNPQETISSEVSSKTFHPRARGDYRQVDYRIFSSLETSQHSVLYDDQSRMVVDGVILPKTNSRNVRIAYDNFSVGIPGIETNRRFNDRIRSESRDPDLVCIQNYRYRNDWLINSAILTDTGKRRFPKYLGAINKPVFTVLDDVCVTANDIARANAAIRAIQSRISQFLLNVLPLADAYPNWGSVGTIKLLSDYLYRKIDRQLKRREILGSMYSLMDSVALVYPNLIDDPKYKNNPVVSSDLTPEENLKNIVEATLLNTLENIQETSEYNQIKKSIFDPTSVGYSRYRNTLYKFYSTILDNFDEPLNYGIEADQAEEVQNKFREFIDTETEDITELGSLVGSYYFPISFQIASYLIYFDTGIKYSDRYEPTNYQSLFSIAASDDGILSAAREQTITKFSETFSGFPLSLTTWEDDRSITYYSTEQVEQRLSDVNNLIENFSLADFDSYGLQELSDSYNLEATTVSDLYKKYFSLESDGIRFLNNRVVYRTRSWRVNLRSETISIIDNWFRIWRGPDEPNISESNQQRIDILNTEITQLRTLINAIPPGLPGSRTQRQRLQSQIDEKINLIEQLSQQDLQSFNFNRDMETSETRARDLQISQDNRDTEEIWIQILENNYKDVEADIFTSPNYYTSLSNYFRQVASYFEDQFEAAKQQYDAEHEDDLIRLPGYPDSIDAYEEASIFFSYVSSVYRTTPETVSRILAEKNLLENLITS